MKTAIDARETPRELALPVRLLGDEYIADARGNILLVARTRYLGLLPSIVEAINRPAEPAPTFAITHDELFKDERVKAGLEDIRRILATNPLSVDELEAVRRRRLGPIVPPWSGSAMPLRFSSRFGLPTKSTITRQSIACIRSATPSRGWPPRSVTGSVQPKHSPCSLEKARLRKETTLMSVDYKHKINQNITRQRVNELQAEYDNADEVADAVLREALTTHEYGTLTVDEDEAATEFIKDRYRLDE